MKIPEEAATDYYTLTIVEYDMGLINRDTLYERFLILSSISTMSALQEYVPPFYRDRGESLREQSQEDHSYECSAEESTFDSITKTHPNRRNLVQPPAPLLLQFMSPSVSGAKKWIFHQADADPYPSIPHGHDDANNKRKLDSYTGRTFIGKIEYSREPQGLLVALWSNVRFRDFARKAVVWYMATYPYYKPRVKYPLRFPRY